jgi:hypothetical protein
VKTQKNDAQSGQYITLSVFIAVGKQEKVDGGLHCSSQKRSISVAYKAHHSNSISLP